MSLRAEDSCLVYWEMLVVRGGRVDLNLVCRKDERGFGTLFCEFVRSYYCWREIKVDTKSCGIF